MSELVPFIKCVHPYKVMVDGKFQQVPCGHCWVCRQNKNAVHAQQLSLTQNHYKYCYFITLTYDEQNVPRFSVEIGDSVSCDYSSINNIGALCNGTIISDDCTVLDGFNGETHTLTRTWSLRPLFSRSRWNTRKTALIPEDIDVTTIKFPRSFSFLEFEPLFTKYSNIRNYYSRHFSKGFTYQPNTVDLLYPRDLKLFIYNIRNYVRKQYNEVPLYYAIGEYGVKSLRPHWHLLLFFNSPLFDRDLQLSSRTSNDGKTYECSTISAFWRYGITDTRKSNGGCTSYVSSYLNRPSDFPQILEYLSRPKSYHSPRLGQTLSQNVVSEIVKSRQFDFFEQNVASNDVGCKYTYSLWKSYYDRIFPRFSFCRFDNALSVYDCWKKIVRINQFCEERNCRSIIEKASFWFSTVSTFCEHGVIAAPIDLLEWSRVIYVCQLPYDLNQLNTFSSIFLYYNRFLRACSYVFRNTFSYSIKEFCSILYDFSVWFDKKNLLNNLRNCEQNDVYAWSYYHNLEEQDMTDPLIRAYLTMSSRSYNKNIKHREFSDLYKFL